jgi:hypothetical protein
MIPRFYREQDILPIQRGIYEIIGQVMIRHGIPDRRFRSHQRPSIMVTLISSGRIDPGVRFTTSLSKFLFLSA